MKEETHTCCNKRLKEEGVKARCCYCVPHDDCELKYEVKRYYLKGMTKDMTSNLEQLEEDFSESTHEFIPSDAKDLCQRCGRFEEEHNEDVRVYMRKAFSLGTLNGLDKAIELLGEEKVIEKGKDDRSVYNAIGFNSCRSQILSKIKEEARKYGN